MYHCSFIRCCGSGTCRSQFILYRNISQLRFAICFNDEKQEGASKEDIEQLTKFKFRKVGGDVNKHAGDEAQGNAEGVMTECGTDSPVEHTILQEDAVSIHYNSF